MGNVMDQGDHIEVLLGSKDLYKIEALCALGFEGKILHSPKEKRFFQMSPNYRKSRIVDYFLPMKRRVAGHVDGQGNQIEVVTYPGESWCKNNCIALNEKTSKRQPVCDYLNGLKCGGTVNSTCGGTVYVPKLTE
jgi:hypothetical protein